MNTPPVPPADVGLVWASCSPTPRRTAGGRNDCARVTGHVLVMGSVLASVWVLSSVWGWWPPLCVEVCVVVSFHMAFHMAGDSHPFENSSHASSVLFLGGASYCFLLLCPGPPSLNNHWGPVHTL